MHATVVRDDRVVFEALAMNDVVVNRGTTSGMVELRVEVGGRLVANQRADGLIIASPTGSRGVLAVRRGAHAHPRFPDGCWCRSRPTPRFQPPHRAVRRHGSGRRSRQRPGRQRQLRHAVLASLLHGDRILVKRSEHCVRFLHPLGWNYFATLRKLRWNEGSS